MINPILLEKLGAEGKKRISGSACEGVCVCVYMCVYIYVYSCIY